MRNKYISITFIDSRTYEMLFVLYVTNLISSTDNNSAYEKGGQIETTSGLVDQQTGMLNINTTISGIFN